VAYRNTQLIFFIFIFVSAPLFGFFIKNNDTFFHLESKKEYLPAGNLAPSIVRSLSVSNVVASFAPARHT
jgi:hypothetical protein